MVGLSKKEAISIMCYSKKYFRKDTLAQLRCPQFNIWRKKITESEL
jgi:hypothetical protein